MRTAILLASLLSVVPLGPLSAQPTKSFQVGLTYSRLSDPLWMQPDGRGEFQEQQVESGNGLRAGFLIHGERFGASADVCALRALFGDVSFSQSTLLGRDGPGWYDASNVTYSAAKYTFGSFDFGLHWFPVEGGSFSVLALAGAGVKWQSFEASGLTVPFQDWNGAKTVSDYPSSYGLGLRWRPVGPVVLTADYRWLPGHSGDLCVELGASRGGGWYECAEWEKHASKKMKLGSVGVLVAF